MSYSLRLTQDRNTEPVNFLTMGEVAHLCGKSTDSLKKLTLRGILPDANFRTPKIKIKRGDNQGTEREGYRLYSKDFLVPILVPYIKKNFKRGILITREQRLELITMFSEERDFYLKK